MFTGMFLGFCMLMAMAMSMRSNHRSMELSKLALDYCELVPKRSPMWSYIKGDWDSLTIFKAFYKPVLVTIVIMVVFLSYISVRVGSPAPIGSFAIFVVPIQMIVTRYMRISSGKILRVVSA